MQNATRVEAGTYRTAMIMGFDPLIPIHCLTSTMEIGPVTDILWSLHTGVLKKFLSVNFRGRLLVFVIAVLST